jgi:uncharacterized membrane protein YkgB
LGVSEWLTCALLLLGFWNKKLGILGAIGSCLSMLGTLTIIPWMPDGWAASAGGFPAMTVNVAFLLKDLVILAASFYLLKQDALRVSLAVPEPEWRKVGTASAIAQELQSRGAAVPERVREIFT